MDWLANPWITTVREPPNTGDLSPKRLLNHPATPPLQITQSRKMDCDVGLQICNGLMPRSEMKFQSSNTILPMDYNPPPLERSTEMP